MYEYLDRPPQVGDIVECTVKGIPKGRLLDSGIAIVTKVSGDRVYFTNLSNEEDWMGGTNTWKVIKTKPDSEARIGDTIICIDKDSKYNDAYGELFTITDIMCNWSHNTTHIRTSPVIDGTSTPKLNSFLVLCKQEGVSMNPFKVGDEVRSISSDNPIDRPKGNVYTVSKIYNTDVYYKDGYATHYSKFELVSGAEPDTSIKVGSHWSFNTDNSDIVVILKVNSDNDVIYKHLNKSNQTYSTNGKWFLENYKPRPDLDKPQLLHQYWKDLCGQGIELEYSTTSIDRWLTLPATAYTEINWDSRTLRFRTKISSQQTEQIKEHLRWKTQKEQTMNKLDLIALLDMMAEAITDTTPNATNAKHIGILTESDGTYVGYVYANTTKELEDIIRKASNEDRQLHVFNYNTTLIQKPREVITVDRA